MKLVHTFLVAGALVASVGCKDASEGPSAGSGGGAGVAGSVSGSGGTSGGGDGGSSGTTGGQGGSGGASGSSGGAAGTGGTSGGAGGTGGMGTGGMGTGGMTGAGGMSGGVGGSGGSQPDPCVRAMTPADKCAVCEDDATCDAATNTDNGDGTVSSSCCDLVWQQGQGEGQFTWEEAKTYCSGLELAGGGWRLPTKDELFSMVVQGNDPPVDMTAFPDLKPGLYWSVTEYTANMDEAWQVMFFAEADGASEPAGKTLTSEARCVR